MAHLGHAVLVLALVLLALLSAQSVHAGSNCLQQSAPIHAANVIGQPVFGSSLTGILNLPLSPALSPVSGKLFISNARTNNVVRFSSAALFINGALPDLAFFGSGSECQANQFHIPSGLFVDASDNLFVADSQHSRVLVFDDASDGIVLDPNAKQVFGQPDFETCSSGSALNQLFLAQAVLVDSARDQLYISDSLNQRVLRFDGLSTQPSQNAFANVAFGTTGTSGCSATQFNEPSGLALDSAGNLWVADFNNNRVLRFNSASTQPSGAAADLVIGQSDLTTCASGTSASTFHSPIALALDPAGALYVSDGNNNRVVGFLKATSLTANGPTADFQIGQPSFTTRSASPPVSASSLNRPVGIAFDALRSGSLLVASAQENRVLRYCTDPLHEPTASNTDAPPSPSSTSTHTTGVSSSHTSVPSSSNTFGFTQSMTGTPAASPSSTPTSAATPSSTPTAAATQSGTGSSQATPSLTSSGAPSPSTTGTAAPTASTTGTAAATPSTTGTAAATPSNTGTAAATSVISASNSNVPTASNSFGISKSSSGAPTGTGTGSQSGSSAATPSTTGTAAATPSPTSSAAPTPSTTASKSGVSASNSNVPTASNSFGISKSTSASTTAPFCGDAGDICGPPPGVCFYPRRCGFVNGVLVCKPANQKPEGTICSLLPLKICNDEGQCVDLL